MRFEVSLIVSTTETSILLGRKHGAHQNTGICLFTIVQQSVYKVKDFEFEMKSIEILKNLKISKAAEIYHFPQKKYIFTMIMMEN